MSRNLEVIADHADSIVELDVNPLICACDRIVAVDALIVRQGAEARMRRKAQAS